MPDYNKVLLMGRLTRDVELKFTPSNMAVANIGLAVGRRYKTKDGEQREETTFVDCEAWSRTAELMNQYLSKGRPVFIEGRLKLDQWQKEVRIQPSDNSSNPSPREEWDSADNLTKQAMHSRGRQDAYLRACRFMYEAA